MAPYTRPFLAAAQTTLAYSKANAEGVVEEHRYPFFGLFTTVAIPRGALIGFYNGTIRDLKGDQPYRGKDAYVISASNVYIKPPRTKKGIEFGKAPIALVNEPAFGSRSNAFFVERSTAKDVVPQLKPNHSITAVVMYASEDIPAGGEIFAHYGSAYDRSAYADPRVGSKSYLNLPLRESVFDIIRSFGISYSYVDEECYRDDDD